MPKPIRPANASKHPKRRERGGRNGPHLSRQNPNPGTIRAKDPKHILGRLRRTVSDGIGTKRIETTLGNGYLGSCIDEERSEMRYLV